MTRWFTILLLFSAVPVWGQSPFGETVTVEVMNVDVVVLDRDGVAVTGLRAEDFELLVNGKPVPITNFSAYASQAGETLAVESAPAAPEAPDAPATAVQAPPPVTWLIYVDLLNTIRNRRKHALDKIETFLRKGGFRPNDRILVSMFQGDAFKVLQPLTTDLGEARKAFTTLRNHARASREFADTPLDTPPEGPLDQEEEERRVRVAINGLRDLTTLVDGIEGRVALFIVSGGYHFETFPLERAARLRATYGNVLARLVEGRVTAYTVYAGMESGDTIGAAEAVAPEGEQLPVPIASFSEVAAFADETGGIAFTRTNADLARVRSDLDHYYSLGFRPPARVRGASLDVDVRVRREGLRVRHRDAVRRRTEAEAAQDVTMSALVADTPPPNPWGVQVRIAGIRKHRPVGYRTTVEIVIPLAQMLLVEREGRHTGRLLFHFALRDAHGYFRRLDPRELPLAIAADDLAKARQQSIRYSVDLILPAGSNDLSVTVADFAGSGRSTVRAPVLIAVRR